MASTADTVVAMIEAERRANLDALRGVARHLLHRADELLRLARHAANAEDFEKAARFAAVSDGYRQSYVQLVNVFPFASVAAPAASLASAPTGED